VTPDLGIPSGVSGTSTHIYKYMDGNTKTRTLDGNTRDLFTINPNPLRSAAFLNIPKLWAPYDAA